MEEAYQVYTNDERVHLMDRADEVYRQWHGYEEDDDEEWEADTRRKRTGRGVSGRSAADTTSSSGAEEETKGWSVPAHGGDNPTLPNIPTMLGPDGQMHIIPPTVTTYPFLPSAVLPEDATVERADQLRWYNAYVGWRNSLRAHVSLFAQFLYGESVGA